MAGGDLSVPVVAESQSLNLFSHGTNIFKRPLGGVGLIFNGGVLCRHSECVPAQRVDNVIALHAFEPGQCVADGIVADMAHVDSPGRIGKHL